VYSQDVDLDSLTHWLPIDALDIPPPKRDVPAVPSPLKARWGGDTLEIWDPRLCGECNYRIDRDTVDCLHSGHVPMWLAKLAAELEWD
jgi:hypothetical protein